MATTVSDILRRHGVRCTEYAVGVAEGRYALSGADLKGKARKYGGSYANTRKAVVKALLSDDSCLVTVRRIKQTGKLVLDWGDGSCPPALPDDAVPVPCALGIDAWTY